MAQAETTLITPRRNFLIRALGFTAAGATIALPILTLDSAKARISHHQRELEKAWRDYYGDNVRIVDDARAPDSVIEHDGRNFRGTSIFLICAGGAPVGI